MRFALRFVLGLALLVAGIPFAASASTVQVTVGTSPAGVAFSVDSTQYTSTQTFTWTVGSTHTLSATSPQTNSGTQYTFSSWSDSGAISHTVTASSSTTSYSATFSTSYELVIATNNSHGTVSPASGSYYASGSKVSITASADSGYHFNEWTGSSDVTDETASSTTIKMKGPESITANFKSNSGGIQYFVPVYIVTTTADDATGDAANCPLGGPAGGAGLNCTLRDAIEAANESGGANVYFDSTVFVATNTAAQNTITLSGGPLILSSTTVVSAPTGQSGNSFKDLVTVSGNQQSAVFWVQSGVSGAEIDNLSIVNGSNAFGGGIYTNGALTLRNSTIANNAAAGGEGGGIYVDVDGRLILSRSTVSGNSASNGGGIACYGVLDLAVSTFSGNHADLLGGGIYLAGTGTIRNVTIAENQATGNVSGSGGGLAIDAAGTLTLSNSIVSGNTASVPVPDVEGTYIDGGGNQVGVGQLNLAPLGNYGGPTQTQIPLPWSPAICVGLDANLSVTDLADQRGMLNTNTLYPGYSAANPCVDAGAVQTNYALAFTSEPAPVAPAASILTGTNFTAAVTLDESGAPFSVPVTIPLSLTGSGTLTGGSVATVNGVAAYSALQISAAGSGDVLMASLALNPPQSPWPLQIATASSNFAVQTLSTTTTAANVAAPLNAAAQGVRLTADVAGGSQTVDAGTVTFTVLSGTAVVGSPVTSATITDGQASANYILPAATAPGVYTIRADYNAGGAFAASSDASHTLTITQAASTTTLTSSSGNANLNASLTLTAMVTGTAALTPTGTVRFYDGPQLLGSASLDGQGAANYTTTSLVAGTHLLTAVYTGDANFAASTSAQYAQTVTAPDYSLTARPSSLSLEAGQTGTVSFTFTPVGGFTGTVNFACTGAPKRVACSFSPTSLTADGSNKSQQTTLTITTEGSASGTVASVRRPASSASPQLARFLFWPALLLGVVLARQRRRLRRAGVWLTAAVLAAVLIGVTACGSSPPTTAAGSYTLVVTASAGGSSSAHTVAFSLTVQ